MAPSPLRESRDSLHRNVLRWSMELRKNGMRGTFAYGMVQACWTLVQSLLHGAAEVAVATTPASAFVVARETNGGDLDGLTLGQLFAVIDGCNRLLLPAGQEFMSEDDRLRISRLIRYRNKSTHDEYTQHLERSLEFLTLVSDVASSAMLELLLERERTRPLR